MLSKVVWIWLIVEAGTISLKPPLKADIPYILEEITGLGAEDRCLAMSEKLKSMGLKARCEDQL